MFHRITCPSCQHKFTIPEGDVGKLANCPNCQTPFKAGKSVSEPDVPMKLQIPAAPAAGLNKTMLGETEPPIKYNCPRCKKPLESPSIEAGTKKPCPSCGQRLQVPAAPRPVAPPQPAINKTMLAVDESIQPMQHAPMPAPPPPVPTPSKKRANSDERSQPSGSGKMIMLVGGGIFLVSILACVGAVMFSGSGGESPEMKKARLEFAKAQADLEELKRSIQAKEAMKEALLAQQKQFDYEKQLLWDKIAAEQKARQRELDEQRERDLKNAAIQSDKILAAKLEEERRRKQDEIDRQAKERFAEKERADNEFKAKLVSLQNQLDAANQQKQQATIIVSQPPPPVYYPPPWSRWNPWGW